MKSCAQSLLFGATVDPGRTVDCRTNILGSLPDMGNVASLTSFGVRRPDNRGRTRQGKEISEKKKSVNKSEGCESGSEPQTSRDERGRWRSEEKMHPCELDKLRAVLCCLAVNQDNSEDVQ
ncbi:hypothetical protein R1flu_020929 [Riccia fluitans]|uniref:Uncharacterized protein n=1 Tax=Riccia fluitans TaxID=41844 RepID=A0ABD1ZMW8_9MARC